MGHEAAEEMVALMERMQIQIDAIAEHRRDMLGAIQRLGERISNAPRPSLLLLAAIV